MRTRKWLAVLGLSLLTTAGFAGLSEVIQVEIDLQPDGSGSAFGAMPAARFSDNDVEFIGCGTRNISVPGSPLFQFAFCQAGDADGNQVFCSTTNPDLVKAVDAISDSSFLTFSFDTNAECFRIGVSTQSLHLRGTKDSKK